MLGAAADHFLCLKNSNFTTCISIFLAVVISNFQILISYSTLRINKCVSYDGTIVTRYQAIRYCLVLMKRDVCIVLHKSASFYKSENNPDDGIVVTSSSCPFLP
jgi:hypothetical protein